MIALINNNFKQNCICAYIVLYLYIADIQLFFIPISSRKIIGFIGLIYLFTKKFHIKSSIVFYVLIMYLTLIVECIISGLFNGFQDISFEILLIVRIIVLFGCYFIYKYWNYLDLKTFLKYFISIVILNDFIALAGFVAPSISQIIMTLEPMGDYVAERYEGLRFIGPGSFRYFEGGVVNCLAIISTFYLYSIKQYSINKTLYILSIILVMVFMITFNNNVYAAELDNMQHNDQAYVLNSFSGNNLESISVRF